MNRIGVPKPLQGDLLESAVGHSQFWFWRQGLVAIARTIVRNALTHRALALRALVLTWTLHWIVVQMRFPAMRLMAGWSWTSWRFQSWIAGYLGVPIPPPSFLIVERFGAVVTGWIVSRLHRPYGPAMATIYLASLLILDLGGFFNSFHRGLTEFGAFGLAINSVFPFVVVLALILAGALAGSCPSGFVGD